MIEANFKETKVFNFIQYFLGVLIPSLLILIFIPHLLSHVVTKVDPKNLVKCAGSVGKVVLKVDDEQFAPSKSRVKVCTLLIFQNSGKKYHEPAFGQHPSHLLYPGFKEYPIKPGNSNSAVLTAWGQFKIHDHIYDEIEGELTVQR